MDKIKLVNSDLGDLDHQMSTEEEEGALKFHQAGFDSYITGVCFQVLKCLVEKNSGKSIYEDIRFRNKFYNAWSYDIPYLVSLMICCTHVHRVCKIYIVNLE